jgi:hypothetical protein
MDLIEFAQGVRRTAPDAPLSPKNKDDRAVFYYENTKYSCPNSVYSIILLADHLAKYKPPKNITFSSRRNVSLRRENKRKVVDRFLSDGDTYNAKQIALIDY